LLGFLSAGLCASSLVAAGNQAAAAATHQAAGAPSSLAQVLSLLRAQERSTFQASYAMVGTSGRTAATFTVYHRYTDYRIDTAHAVALVLGTRGYSCTMGQAHPTCVKMNPIVAESLVTGVMPRPLISQFTAIQSGRLAGTTFSTSRHTIGGQHATCLIIKQQSGAKAYAVTYCVTSKVIAYVGTSAGSIRLTHFSGSVAASLFALPKGAVVSSAP
jgi:hypothetical protein